MTYLIRVLPVTRSPKIVVKHLVKYMEMGQDEAVNVARAGGVVDRNLTKKEATVKAAELKKLGVDCQIVPMEEGNEQYHLILKDAGDRKINVIKEIRTITGFGLAESKKLVDRLGKVGVYYDRLEVDRLKEILEAAGAEVIIEAFGGSDPLPVEPDSSEKYVVYGEVINPDQTPAAGIRVKAFDRDMRNEELLGETLTGGKGDYLIEYRPESFENAEAGRADLIIRAYSKTGKEYPLSVFNRDLPKIGSAHILFNASREEDISFQLIEPDGPKQSRYEVFVETLTPLLGEVNPAGLGSEDILFLHHETGRNVSEISFFSEDKRLSDQTGMPVAVFYGLAMRETGIVVNKEERLSIDLPTVAGKPLENLLDEVKQAIEANLIPLDLKDELDHIQHIFEQIIGRYHKQNPEIKRTRIQLVTRLSGLGPELEQTVTDRILIRNEPSGKDPLDELAEEGVLDNEQVKKIQTVFEISALTGGNQDMTDVLVNRSLNGLKNLESVRDLAVLDKSDLKKLIQENNVALSAGITPDTFAGKLAREVEIRYPSAVLNQRVLKKDYTNVYKGIENVESLLENNEKLFGRLTKGTLSIKEVNLSGQTSTQAKKLKKDLGDVQKFVRTFSRLGISEILDDDQLSVTRKREKIQGDLKAMTLFLEKNSEMDLRTTDFFGVSKNGASDMDYEGIPEETKPGVRKQAMAFQRAMNLAPDMDTAHALLACGLDSAGRIQAYAPVTISKMAGIDVPTATTVYRRANAVSIEAKRAGQQLSAEHQGVRIEPGFMSLSSQVDTELRKIDGYEDLFGPQNYCSCRHCTSIFGPIAYFVDLMRFTDKHILTPEFQGDNSNNLHLKSRRRDLWETELTCSAATKLIPTLTIVNEVLESYVASDTSTSDAGELARIAYKKLENSSHSFNLPFHRPLTELRVYLDKLGIELSDLVELVHGWGEQAARESLKLSKKGASRIINRDSSESFLRTLYGRKAGESMNEIPVPLFLKVTGLSRSELSRLVKLPLISNGSGPKIQRQNVPGTPNRFEETLVGLNLDILDRIHRFIRLANVLPWEMEETDYLLRHKAAALFDSSTASDREDALEKIATIARVQQRFNVNVDVLISLFDLVPADSVKPGEPALYDRLFNPVRMSPDSSEKWSPENPQEFRYTLLFESGDSEDDPDENYYRLLEAAGLGENDFETILKQVLKRYGDAGNSTFQLTHELLSKLVRYAELVRILKLEPDSFFKALSLLQDRDPDDVEIDGLQHLLELLGFLDWQKTTPFSIGEIYDLVNGTGSGWTEERINAVLMDVRQKADEADFSADEVAASIASSFGQSTSRFLKLCTFTDYAPDDDSQWMRLTELSGGDLPRPVLAFFREMGNALLWAGPLGFDADGIEFIASNPEIFGIETGRPLTPESVRKLSSFAEMQRRVKSTEQLNSLLQSGSGDINLLADVLEVTPSYMASIVENIPLPGTGNTNGLPGAIDRLQKVRHCIEASRKMKINGRTLNHLVSESYESLENAHSAIIAAFKSVYDDPETFEAEFRSSQDRIRELRRDALVDHILTSPDLSFDTTRDIYYHLLLDTEVAGCADTSRIVQATKSVQLYLHRSLMGLEVSKPGVDTPVHITPTSEMREEWEWRKNYRVWEANRKVFVYPENYLDPDIRDNKTPLFEQLEDTLLQQDITAETVENAYRTYLEGLQDISGLQIHSACYNEEEEAYYFLGTTSKQDGRYFIRKMSYMGDAAGWKTIIYDSERAAEWESWEEINLKINAPVVTPYFYRGRLHLFWITITPENETTVNNGSVRENGKTFTITLNISYRTQGDGWSDVQEIELTSVYRRFPELIHQEGDRFKNIEYKVYPFERGPILYIDYLKWQSSDSEVHRSEINLFSGTSKEVAGIVKSSITPDGAPSDYFRLYDVHTPRDRYKMFGYLEEYSDDMNIDIFDGRDNKPLSRLHNIPANSVDVTSLSTRGFYPDDSSVRRESFIYTVHNAPGSTILRVKDQLYFLELQIDLFLVFPLPHWRAWSLTTGAIGELGSTLMRKGIDGFLSPETSGGVEDSPFPLPLPNTSLLQVQDSFHSGGPFEAYYRELFLHLPLLIARHLNAAGDFEGAQKWYHYIFDPTTDEAPPSSEDVSNGISPAAHYWKYHEFRNSPLHAEENLLGSSEAVAQYRKNPFNPHAIARIRMRAYQKSIVMDYVDNILDWADNLFTSDTRESINEASMLFAMAADILGPKPVELGECDSVSTGNKGVSFQDLQIEGEFDISMENMVVSNQARIESGSVKKARDENAGNLSLLKSLRYSHDMKNTQIFAGGSKFHIGEKAVISAKNGKPRLEKASAAASMMPGSQEAFCLPENEQLLGYWERVEDRLFKIRNCMNIEGEKRSLALFAPPIDPAMMTRAMAAGLSLGDAVRMSADEVPVYRFEVMLERAKSYTATVRNFGSALLSVLEKKDAEELRLLQSTHQQNIQQMATDIKIRQIEIEKENLVVLNSARDMAESRKNHYDELITSGLSIFEKANLGFMTTAQVFEHVSNTFNTAASVASAVPQVGAPTAMTYGGVQVGAMLTALGGAAGNHAGIARFGASMSSTLGGYDRRKEGWELQKKQAGMEVEQLDTKILAAEIRVSLAEYQLEIHRKSIEQSEELFVFYEEKFTSLGLYTWLSTELNRLYRDAYNLANEVALMAQRSYQYERDDTSMFIQPDHWSGNRAGLLAGEKLQLQLARLEKAHMQTNHRDYEVDQTFSLSQINPLALHGLKETGSCHFGIPELFFDMTYPGQYNRRIKSVRLTIPCVTGPYVNINAKLTLAQSHIRKEAKPDTENKSYLKTEHRSRNLSIATSRAQNDGGIFELNFHDPRYMPFEGAGAVSEWKLELPEVFRSFDYESIADVLLHISYTAKEDGLYRHEVEDTMQKMFNGVAKETGIQRILSLDEEFASQFRHLFIGIDNPEKEYQTLTLKLGYRHFPYYLKGKDIGIEKVGAGLILRDPWKKKFSEDNANQESIDLVVQMTSGEKEVNENMAIGNGHPSSPYDGHPYGEAEFSSDTVRMDENGVELTLSFNRDKLVDFYKFLTEDEISDDNDEMALAVGEVIEDVHLFFQVKLE